MIYVHCGGMNTKMHEKDYRAKIDDPTAQMKSEDVAKILIYWIYRNKRQKILILYENNK
jgi:short-subunit dehydrogenase